MRIASRRRRAARDRRELFDDVASRNRTAGNARTTRRERGNAAFTRELGAQDAHRFRVLTEGDDAFAGMRAPNSLERRGPLVVGIVGHAKMLEQGGDRRVVPIDRDRQFVRVDVRRRVRGHDLGKRELQRIVGVRPRGQLRLRRSSPGFECGEECEPTRSAPSQRRSERGATRRPLVEETVGQQRRGDRSVARRDRARESEQMLETIVGRWTVRRDAVRRGAGAHPASIPCF